MNLPDAYIKKGVLNKEQQVFLTKTSIKVQSWTLIMYTFYNFSRI